MAETGTAKTRELAASRRAWLVAGLAAMVLGTALRFAALDHRALWYDELASLRRSTEMTFAEHMREMRGNHPLYELAVLRPWTRLGQSDTWIRLPSALAGSLTLILVWLLARIFSLRVATLSTWLLAVSPLHLLYSRMARPYALAGLFAAVATWFLVLAVRRRRRRFIVGYVLAASALALTNLFAVSLLLAQALFLLWFYRRRPRALLPWAVAAVAAALLLAPWFLPNVAAATRWSQDTPYRAQQMGTAVKLLYIPFTFALGETVHPLNWIVVLPALFAFGTAFLAVLPTLRRHCGPRFFGVQLVIVVLVGLGFKAAAAKHMLVALPAFFIVLAVGLERLRAGAARDFALAGMLAVSTVGCLNYFGGREFHDADMATPWREIAGVVTAEQRPGDAILIGYRGDMDTWRMFQRYYHGGLPSAWLFAGDWRANLDAALKTHPRVWLLLHDLDPHAEIEAWLCARPGVSLPQVLPFQVEEHTLQGLREGLGQAHKYRSALYTLFLISRESPGATPFLPATRPQ